MVGVWLAGRRHFLWGWYNTVFSCFGAVGLCGCWVLGGCLLGLCGRVGLFIVLCSVGLLLVFVGCVEIAVVL